MRTQLQNFYSIISSKLRQVYDFITTSYWFLYFWFNHHIRDGEIFASSFPPRFTIHHSRSLSRWRTQWTQRRYEGDFIADMRETDRYTKSIVASYWFMYKFLKSISLSGQCSSYSDLYNCRAKLYLASNYYFIQPMNVNACLALKSI